MKEIWLITGGAGNLACQLTYRLAASDRTIVLFDIADQPVANTADGCKYIQGDISNPADIAHVFEHARPDVVVHFASLLSGRSESDRGLAWRVNMDGAFELFEQSLQYNVNRFFFPSSVASFGAPLPNPVPEDFPQWPIGFYGVTKACIERLGIYYHERHGLDFRCIRVPIVVSPWAHAGAASSYASMAFIESMRNGQFTFRVRPQSHPALIYIDDLTRAVVELCEAPAEQLTRRCYNVQALSPSSTDLAEAIRARIPNVEVTFETDPKIADLIDSWPVQFEDASARSDWGWTPQFDLDSMANDFTLRLQN